MALDFGVHLPLADLGQGMLEGHDLRAYAASAAKLGFETLCANDHLVWRSPWLGILRRQRRPNPSPAR